MQRITAQQIYEDLHGRIVQGALRPGDALSEATLAQSYGISRTKLREAIWRLNEEGFLRVVPQVGTFIAPIRVQAVSDAQFVRETLECRAITDAAAAAKPKDIAALRRLLTQQTAAIKSGDFATFFTLDEAMHRQFLATAGRAEVWQMIAGAKAQLDRVRFLSLHEPAWPGMILDQHAALIDALATHDAERAETVMRQHLRTAFAAIDTIAAEHADFFEGTP